MKEVVEFKKYKDMMNDLSYDDVDYIVGIDLAQDECIFEDVYELGTCKSDLESGFGLWELHCNEVVDDYIKEDEE